jgi:hypothetical protein
MSKIIEYASTETELTTLLNELGLRSTKLGAIVIKNNAELNFSTVLALLHRTMGDTHPKSPYAVINEGNSGPHTDLPIGDQTEKSLLVARANHSQTWKIARLSDLPSTIARNGINTYSALRIKLLNLFYFGTIQEAARLKQGDAIIFLSTGSNEAIHSVRRSWKTRRKLNGDRNLHNTMAVVNQI